MSLLLDALKEAGTHRKTAVQKAEEQAEPYDGDLELELELDVEDIDEAVLELQDDHAETDVEIKSHEKNVEPGNDEQKHKNVEAELDTPVVEFESQAAEEQVEARVRKDPQGEISKVDEPPPNQVANAVFRNRTQTKFGSSKIIIASLLIIFAVLLIAYLSWTLTSDSLFEENTTIYNNPVRSEMDAPLVSDDIKTVVDNSSESEMTPAGGAANTSSIHKSEDKKRLDLNGNTQVNLPVGGNLELGTYSHGIDPKKVGEQRNDVALNESSEQPVERVVDEISIRKRKVPNKTRRNITQAKQAMAAGEWRVAQKKYSEALAGSSDNVEALVGMADVLSVLGKSDSARSHYLKALEKSPGELNASVGLLNLNVDKTALSHGSKLKQLLAENPGQAFIHANLGDYYVGREEWSAAQAEYFDAFALQPVNADYAFNLAVCLDQLGKMKIAVRYYKQALALKMNGAGRFEEKAVLKRIKELSRGGK